MKRVIPALLAIAIMLGASACAKETAPVTSAPTISPEQASSYVGDALLTVYRGLIGSAIDIAENIFDYGSLECAKDEPPVTQNGRTYYRVTSEQFTSYNALKEYLESIFTADAAAALMANGKYIDIDGKLYCDAAAYQSESGVDFSNFAFVPSRKTADSCKLDISVSLNGKDAIITINAINKNGDWRLDSAIETSKITPIERSDNS